MSFRQLTKILSSILYLKNSLIFISNSKHFHIITISSSFLDACENVRKYAHHYSVNENFYSSSGNVIRYTHFIDRLHNLAYIGLARSAFKQIEGTSVTITCPFQLLTRLSSGMLYSLYELPDDKLQCLLCHQLDDGLDCTSQEPQDNLHPSTSFPATNRRRKKSAPIYVFARNSLFTHKKCIFFSICVYPWNVLTDFTIQLILDLRDLHSSKSKGQVLLTLVPSSF